MCIAFGWFDHVSPFNALALAVGVLAIQVPLSVWWLREYPYGPIEAVWRRVSYGTA